MPFVVIDEACQSVEPADLIPVTSTDSCRCLVLVGDPCQLPPTVRTDTSGGTDDSAAAPLSTSLMARLASTLPRPVIVTARGDDTEREDSYLDALPTKRAASLVRYRSDGDGRHRRRRRPSYRRRYGGSILLSVQYRMHPSISAFPSAVFYDGLLSTPASLAGGRTFPPSIGALLPADGAVGIAGLGVRFVNVGGRNNERRGGGGGGGGRISSGPDAQTVSPPTAGTRGGGDEDTSYRNEAEADEIMSLLKVLLRGYRGDDGDGGASAPPPSIGIVTPYAAQVALLESMMSSDSEFRSLREHFPSTVEVKSVDGYQGRERDVVIFSAVRSNRRGRVGFLADWRRMNVALTRARSGLVVFGDLETLREGDRHWEAFGNWCEGVGCVTDAGID